MYNVHMRRFSFDFCPLNVYTQCTLHKQVFAQVNVINSSAATKTVAESAIKCAEPLQPKSYSFSLLFFSEFFFTLDLNVITIHCM
jgi:hypothetical protein